MKLRLIESLRVEMVKPDEIPALWEETASSPGKTGKAEQDVTAGVWRPLYSKMVGNDGSGRTVLTDDRYQ